jgi:2-polyprenyl-6-methoxyphenol hydroxylase-like FAD-dependent oxidoreductase
MLAYKAILWCDRQVCALTSPKSWHRVGDDMSAVETVLIVGGGLAGPTPARALNHQGLTVELIERGTEWRAKGGGIAVQPNGMRILRTLGLDAAARRAPAAVVFLRPGRRHSIRKCGRAADHHGVGSEEWSDKGFGKRAAN